jgi:predicted nucleic acid-binding protein
MTTATATTASKSVLVDSSGWLEYLTVGSKADAFAPYIEGQDPIIVPTIVLYEVRKILLLRSTKTEADLFVSQALRLRIACLDEPTALLAASLSIRHQLPMADAIIYATARLFEANLVTSDAHFTGLPSITLL